MVIHYYLSQTGTNHDRSSRGICPYVSDTVRYPSVRVNSFDLKNGVNDADLAGNGNYFTKGSLTDTRNPCVKFSEHYPPQREDTVRASVSQLPMAPTVAKATVRPGGLSTDCLPTRVSCPRGRRSASKGGVRSRVALNHDCSRAATCGQAGTAEGEMRRRHSQKRYVRLR